MKNFSFARFVCLMMVTFFTVLSTGQVKNSIDASAGKKTYHSPVQPAQPDATRPISTKPVTQNRKPSTLPTQTQAKPNHIPVERNISENPEPVPFQDHPGYTTATHQEVTYVAPKPAVIRMNDIWKKKFITNAPQAKKENRHCGCGGDITFVNNTSDTLDIYFKYLTAAETPTIDGVVLPPLINSSMYAPFYIVPGESATVRGYCTGGLRYEAVTRNSMTQKDNYLTPRLWLNGSVRMSCIEKTILLEEKADSTLPD